MTATIGVGVMGRPRAEKEPVPTVVFIGRLSANKRPDHAIRAFGYVRGQLPEAQMWVIGSGPEEARLRKMAGPGVTFFGRVTEEEKRQRLGRAHALVATSVREGWGLVVTEAAANGTVSIGYDVAGLRDSIGASGGILTRANPVSLATGLARLLSSVGAGDVYLARPAGVVPWTEVADGILSVARESESPATQVLGKVGTRGRHRAAGAGQRLFRVRVGLGVLGVALLFPLGSTRDLGLSQILAGSAFLALLAATLIGSFEGLRARRGHNQLQADVQSAPQGAGMWPSRIGLAFVGLTTSVATQFWFDPGRLLAGGDLSPVVGTAWLGRLFAPWSWSGSNLGGPASNETNLPFAAVYWLVHVLHGSPALAERIWYTALFAGAAMACCLLLRAFRIGPVGAALGALAYVFNAHVLTLGSNPVYFAAMVLLAGLPAVVLTTASGRWSLRKGILLLGASAPLLGYVFMNPPLVLMIGVLLASTPLLAGWIYGRTAGRRALRTLALGAPLLALASAYWLVPTLLQTKADATSTLATTSSWIWTEGRATLANGFWLNNSWAWKFPEYFPYAGAEGKFPLLILKFLLPITAFGFLALARFPRVFGGAARRGRLGIAASATALFLVLLSTGTRFPGAFVFDPLYRLPLGWLLREPGRFLILGGLAYSVLLALTTEAAWEKLKSLEPGIVSRWRSALNRPGLRLAAVSVAGAAVLAPGFPLMTGAIAPSHRPLLPSTRVSVPAYWTAMASYLNSSAPPGNLLVLPQDDFYQMPYTWGYYGADGFIRNLIARNVVDPVAQGYTPGQQEIIGAVHLVQRGLLVHDWPSVQRTLGAIGAPLLLVRGDVNAAFPGRHITPPATLASSLREDPGVRLVRRFGKLELFALRAHIEPAGSVTSYATVNSATPDLRDLSLFPSATALITSPMRPADPAVLQVPPVSQWRLVGDELQTSVAEQPGRHYNVELLSSTGAFRRPGASSGSRRARTRRAGSPRRPKGHPSPLTRQVSSRSGDRIEKPPERLITRVGHRDGQVVEELSYKLGGSLLSESDFASGAWGAVGNCAALRATEATARLSAHVLPGQGPAGQSVLALSASANSACENRSLAWRSGPLFVSLWVRNVEGTGPRICLLQMPGNECAVIPPVGSNQSVSRWDRYQTIVTPDPGTRSLKLFLYADVYKSGTRTTNEYSDVVVRRSPVLPQPVVAATPRIHAPSATTLYTSGESFSPDWIGPPNDLRVKVDGLRNGWLGPHSSDVRPRFAQASWYLLSRFASLLAAGLLIVLAVSLWPERRYLLVARARVASERRIRGQHLGG
jgi:arabinofuranan 3-O-arabinosyltransferase